MCTNGFHVLIRRETAIEDQPLSQGPSIALIENYIGRFRVRIPAARLRTIFLFIVPNR